MPPAFEEIFSAVMTSTLGKLRGEEEKIVEREEAKNYPGVMNTRFTKSAIPPPHPLLHLHSGSGPSYCALTPPPEAALGHQLSESFLPGHSFPNRLQAETMSSPHHTLVGTASLC